MGEMYGIDVSHHNGLINWSKVKSSGKDFAIFKCQYESKSHRKDETFDFNYAESGKHGLKRGVYIYIAAASIDNPEYDAQCLIKNLGVKNLELGIWLDLEDKSLADKGKDYICRLSKIYLEIFKKAGYFCGIYCNLDWYKRLIHDDLKKSCKIWLARYPKNDTGVYNPASSLKPTDKNIVMWQYSSKGKIAGIRGNVDLDVMLDSSFNSKKSKKSDNPFELKSNLLKFGFKGESVKWLQYELNRHGANLNIDGIFGNATKNALISFQKNTGLMPDGIFGIKTKNKFYELF